MTAAAPRSARSSLAIIMGFGALLFLAFAFGLRFMWFFGEPALPTLLQGLPDSRTEADQSIYLARLHDAFPPSSTEADVTGRLTSEGFKLGGSDRIATYDRRAGLNDKCQRSGNIRWSVGADGRVSEVTGGYYQHCPAH